MTVSPACYRRQLFYCSGGMVAFIVIPSINAKCKLMGADLQQPQFQPPEPKKKSLLPFIIGSAAILIVCALQWSDVIEYIEGEPQLIAKHQNQLQKKLNDLEVAEQYALVAMAEGWYPCLHSVAGRCITCIPAKSGNTGLRPKANGGATQAVFCRTTGFCMSFSLKAP